LRADANWWHTNFTWQVKIALLFSIAEKTRIIQIKQWEIGTNTNSQITCCHNNYNGIRHEFVKTIEIAKLKLNFVP